MLLFRRAAIGVAGDKSRNMMSICTSRIVENLCIKLCTSLSSVPRTFPYPTRNPIINILLYSSYKPTEPSHLLSLSHIHITSSTLPLSLSKYHAASASSGSNNPHWAASKIASPAVPCSHVSRKKSHETQQSGSANEMGTWAAKGSFVGFGAGGCMLALDTYLFGGRR